MYTDTKYNYCEFDSYGATEYLEPKAIIIADGVTLNVRVQKARDMGYSIPLKHFNENLKNIIIERRYYKGYTYSKYHRFTQVGSGYAYFVGNVQVSYNYPTFEEILKGQIEDLAC